MFFIGVVRDICTIVHVDDMLAVGPKDATEQLLQDLARDMEMRWSMVIETTRIIGHIFEKDDERLLVRRCG